ncbi:hypothetical protein VTL71DRAFT_15441 [Oculimacula yallundae]|uniref:2EXR domain-containing protein n=1 Tax=Oculimacula yallundae TaxID=86028 RepID=A0ABR4CGR0_9HELO
MPTTSSSEVSEIFEAPVTSNLAAASMGVDLLSKTINITFDTIQAELPVLTIPEGGAIITPQPTATIQDSLLPAPVPQHYIAPIRVESTARNIPTEFTLFNRLPLELRTKIIHHSIPHFPCILQVKPITLTSANNTSTNTNSNTHNTTEDISDRYDVITTSSTPLLQVSSEFRNEVSRYYTSPFTFKSGTGRDISRLLVNWEIDTLFVRSMHEPRLASWTPLIVLRLSPSSQLDLLWQTLFSTNTPQVKLQLRKLAGSVSYGFAFWSQIIGSFRTPQRLPDAFAKFAVFDEFMKLEEVVSVTGPWTSHEKSNRLLKFKDVKRRHPLWEGHVGWYADGFNRETGPRGKGGQSSRKVVTKLCSYYGTMDEQADSLFGA